MNNDTKDPRERRAHPLCPSFTVWGPTWSFIWSPVVRFQAFGVITSSFLSMQLQAYMQTRRCRPALSSRSRCSTSYAVSPLSRRVAVALTLHSERFRSRFPNSSVVVVQPTSGRLSRIRQTIQTRPHCSVPALPLPRA